MNSRVEQLSFFFILCISGNVIASGGTQNSEIDWHKPDQFIEYRSCGCADSCWIAKVKEWQSKKVLATLRCDCSTLYFSRGKGKEQQLSPTCSAFENEQKFQHISTELQRLLERHDNIEQENQPRG